MKILNFPIILFGYFLSSDFHFSEALDWGLSSDPKDIHFYLYSSSSNSSQEIIYNNESSITNSDFQFDQTTIIMVHGFWSNSSSHFPLDLKNAYLRSIQNCNYIGVDWGKLSTSPYSGSLALYPVIYPEVVRKSIPIVSRRIANFVYFLERNNYTSLDKIHMIGHSLGAHISGHTGNLITKENKVGAKIGRITGLDPAGPGFDQGVQLHAALKKDDANFVDVYHSAMGTRGDSTVDGHVDFYPNGGIIQPACPNDLIPTDPFGRGHCSHQFIVDIYASSIFKKIIACQCNPSLSKKDLNKCLSDCPNSILAGEPCPSEARGQYYFETSSNP